MLNVILKNHDFKYEVAELIKLFTSDFEFVGNKTSICKQIGNAVPPKLAYFFGLMIKRMVEND